MADSVPSPASDSPATLLNVQQIASMLKCSPRHVYRMADSGAMPRPRHLGSLIRWSQIEIEEWVAAGCPSCRPGAKARAR
jgi:excisionase family DNA binding protein